MTTYIVATVSPRPADRARVLDDLRSTWTLGVEVTVPELAAECALGNLDPQHSGGDPDTSAAEAAVGWPLPPAGSRLVTVRPDADALTAMAVLELRSRHEFGPNAERRARAIGVADRSPSGSSPDEPVEAVSDVSAIRALAVDAIVPLYVRWLAVISYLQQGSSPLLDITRARVLVERRETVDLDSQVNVRTVGGALSVAVIESDSRFAVSAGYRHADTVVAINPRFRFAGGAEHRKITVCVRRRDIANLTPVWDVLAEIEPGWGGSPVVGGSPQGEPTQVSVDDVLAALATATTSPRSAQVREGSQ